MHALLLTILFYALVDSVIINGPNLIATKSTDEQWIYNIVGNRSEMGRLLRGNTVYGTKGFKTLKVVYDDDEQELISVTDNKKRWNIGIPELISKLLSNTISEQQSYHLSLTVPMAKLAKEQKMKTMKSVKLKFIDMHGKAVESDASDYFFRGEMQARSSGFRDPRCPDISALLKLLAVVIVFYLAYEGTVQGVRSE